jgi:hypothetical protein
MHPSIIAILLLPVLVVVGLLVRAAVTIVRALRRHQRPSGITIAGLFAGLLVIDGVLSIVITVDAALGHSEAAKTAATWHCLALFLVLVVIPPVALVIAIRRVRSADQATSP